MAFTKGREAVTLDLMQHPMRDYAPKGDGVLIGRAAGERARHDVERAIRGQTPGSPIALDFKGVRSVGVPFADALLVPLISNRATGYYEDLPLLAINTTEDVGETLAATLERRNLFILRLPPPPQLLGAEATLDETMKIAHELGRFSVLELAEHLGITQQATNNRVKQLLRNGALVRTRVTPARGGKEFLYEVPEPVTRRGTESPRART